MITIFSLFTLPFHDPKHNAGRQHVFDKLMCMGCASGILVVSKCSLEACLKRMSLVWWLDLVFVSTHLLVLFLMFY